MSVKSLTGRSSRQRVYQHHGEHVGNVLALPEDYIKYSDPTVDKTALKKALKNGEEIEGARLVIRQNLQIK